MSSFRLLQISDTHLSRKNPYFLANWERVAHHVNATRPDLVINTGDVALDGTHDGDDLVFAAELHQALDCPVHAVPGNHDLGDNPVDGIAVMGHAVTDGRRAVWHRLFGDDFWSVDVGRWRLVGLNAQLFGTGIDGEDAQWSFLTAALADAGDRSVALFLHKPLFKTDPSETIEARHRYVPEAQRDRLMQLFATARMRLVASGHVHQYRAVRYEAATHVWCPSTAFIIPDDLQPLIGEKQVGLIEYDFRDDDVSFRHVKLDGMQDTLITDTAAYGDIREEMKTYGVRPDVA